MWLTNSFVKSNEIRKTLSPWICQWNCLSLCHLGGYIYTEASEPQMLRHRAMLMGPRVCGRMCLQFYYNMYGKRMGSLNVYKREGMQNDDMIWTLSGNQGKDWHEAIVDVGGACYQVRTSSLSYKWRPTHGAMGCFNCLCAKRRPIFYRAYVENWNSCYYLADNNGGSDWFVLSVGYSRRRHLLEQGNMLSAQT